jgi:hypothetical protein
MEVVDGGFTNRFPKELAVALGIEDLIGHCSDLLRPALPQRQARYGAQPALGDSGEAHIRWAKASCRSSSALMRCTPTRSTSMNFRGTKGSV